MSYGFTKPTKWHVVKFDLKPMAWLWGFVFQRKSFPLMRPSASSSSCCARFLVSLFCRSTLRLSCALFFELLWSSRYLDPRGVRVHLDQRISECNVLTLSHWVSFATQFGPCKRRHRRKNTTGARGASGCSHWPRTASTWPNMVELWVTWRWVPPC